MGDTELNREHCGLSAQMVKVKVKAIKVRARCWPKAPQGEHSAPCPTLVSTTAICNYHQRIQC